MLIKYFFTVFFGFSLFCYAEVGKIAFVVNKDIITRKELNDRAKLMAFLQGSPYVTSSIEAQVKQMLVNEAIQSQVARQQKISVTNDDVNFFVNDIAKKNNMSLKTFKKNFEDAGVNFETFVSYIKAQALWSRIAREALSGLVRVSHLEVKRAREKNKISQKEANELVFNNQLQKVTTREFLKLKSISYIKDLTK